MEGTGLIRIVAGVLAAVIVAAIFLRRRKGAK